MTKFVVSGEQYRISSGGHEATIVEVGGGLRRYRVDGVDVVDGYASGEICPGCAGQILAPWPNRIRDGHYMFDGVTHELPLTEPARHNAIHGLVNWLMWHPVAASADSVRVATDVAPQPGYPWRLHLEVTWTISASGLRSETEVTNESETRCPFGFSVHPYLQVPGTAVDDLVLRVPARSRLLADGRLLPIGAARVSGSEFDYTQGRRIGSSVLDTAFGELERTDGEVTEVTLSTVEGTGVRMWADPAFGWWQVFTSDTLPGERRRRSVAVEPMTCPPDAFRSGRDLIVLEPGQTWSGVWGLTTL